MVITRSRLQLGPYGLSSIGGDIFSSVYFFGRVSLVNETELEIRPDPQGTSPPTLNFDYLAVNENSSVTSNYMVPLSPSPSPLHAN